MIYPPVEIQIREDESYGSVLYLADREKFFEILERKQPELARKVKVNERNYLQSALVEVGCHIQGLIYNET